MPIKEPKEKFVRKRIPAAICAFLVGHFGIHKFMLGHTTPGIIMAVLGVATCGTVPYVIAFIEGIIYLTKDDDEFYQIYAVEGKEWF